MSPSQTRYSYQLYTAIICQTCDFQPVRISASMSQKNRKLINTTWDVIFWWCIGVSLEVESGLSYLQDMVTLHSDHCPLCSFASWLLAAPVPLYPVVAYLSQRSSRTCCKSLWMSYRNILKCGQMKTKLTAWLDTSGSKWGFCGWEQELTSKNKAEVIHFCLWLY